MKLITVFILAIVLLVGCAQEEWPEKHSGLTKPPTIEGPKIVEEPPVIIKEQPKQKPTQEIPKPTVEKEEYSHPKISEILEQIRWRMGFAKAQVNQEVCKVLRYKLEYLETKRADEIFGLQCPRTFLFFGYGRSGLFTFDVKSLAEYFSPKDTSEESIAKAREEFKFLVKEAIRI